MLRGQWGWNGAMVTDGNGVGEGARPAERAILTGAFTTSWLAGYLYETYGHGALDCKDAATGPTNACQWGLRGG